MPVSVKVYTWDPRMDEMALNELDWTMYELPTPGSHYWHDRWGYTVREVDEMQDPPHVHLVHDRAYEEEPHGRVDALQRGHRFVLAGRVMREVVALGDDGFDELFRVVGDGVTADGQRCEQVGEAAPERELVAVLDSRCQRLPMRGFDAGR